MAMQAPLDKQERDSRLYGMLCHLLALSGIIGIPLGHILGPLVMWLVKRDEYPFVEEQGKESLNFQLSFTLYALISGITIVGLILWPVIIVVDIVYVVIASVKTNEGVPYRYPLTIRFIK